MKVSIGKYPSQRSLKKDPKAERKVSVRIDPQDVWGLDSTLALVIAPALRLLKETQHGYPTDLDGLPEDVMIMSEEARWDWVMDEMIWAFEQANLDWEDQYYSGVVDVEMVPVPMTQTFRMIDGPNNTMKIDHDGLKAHVARMKRGFALFGKHYMDLWD